MKPMRPGSRLCLFLGGPLRVFSSVEVPASQHQRPTASQEEARSSEPEAPTGRAADHQVARQHVDTTDDGMGVA